MRHLLFAAMIFVACAWANAAVPIPPELAGIWAREGAQFKGQLLMKGEALYIDSDGLGGSIGGDGMAVIGVRLQVRSYDPVNQTLSVDYTENGKVVFNADIMYDPIEKVLYSPKSINRFTRYADAIASDTRKTLGLEAKNN